MKGVIIDTDFRIHYTHVKGKRKLNEVTQVFQLPLIFYNENENNIFDSKAVIDRALVKNEYVKFKDIQENKIINTRIEIVKKLKNLGFTNYEI